LQRPDPQAYRQTLPTLNQQPSMTNKLNSTRLQTPRHQRHRQYNLLQTQRALMSANSITRSTGKKTHLTILELQTWETAW
jgi:hypothetical protein